MLFIISTHAQYISTSLGIPDGDIINLSRQYKGGWSPKANVCGVGEIGILDHQQFRRSLSLPPLTFDPLPSSPLAGMTAAGGGTNKAKVWYNGTNWTVMGK
jgi:hypothetical protein